MLYVAYKLNTFTKLHAFRYVTSICPVFILSCIEADFTTIFPRKAKKHF